MLPTALFLSLISLTFALPEGAPICNLNSSEFNGAHGDAPAETDNSLVVTPGEDLKATIQVTGEYKGLLIWVSDNVGTFEDLPAELKHAGNCNNAAVTHTNSEIKKDTQFGWKADSEATYTVHAVVLKDKNTWAKLEKDITVGQMNAFPEDSAEQSKVSEVVEVVPDAEDNTQEEENKREETSHHQNTEAYKGHHKKKCHPKPKKLSEYSYK